MTSRCFGNGVGKEFYADYHDNEWGVPIHCDFKLFELLILEGAQAGLSWELILKKRRAYRELFLQFDPKKVAAMSDEKLDQLKENSRIIRNRQKIYAARQNARVFLKIQQEFDSFDTYLWKYVEGRPLVNKWHTLSEVPCETPMSREISKDLKNRGMAFVGPTILYSYLQAVGVVDDHLVSCWKREG